MARKSKYSQKTVAFGGGQITLYSLDGITWSSRKEELEAILERHEQEKANFGGQIKGGPQAKPFPGRPRVQGAEPPVSGDILDEAEPLPEDDPEPDETESEISTVEPEEEVVFAEKDYIEDEDKPVSKPKRGRPAGSSGKPAAAAPKPQKAVQNRKGPSKAKAAPKQRAVKQAVKQAARPAGRQTAAKSAPKGRQKAPAAKKRKVA